MKRIHSFAAINILILTGINIFESIFSKIMGIEFIYKHSSTILFIFFVIIPLYLLISENFFISKLDTKLLLSNLRVIFIIISLSNFLSYLANDFIIDKIFDIMPDIDNLMAFIIYTICQTFVLGVLTLFNLLFIKVISKSKLKD